MSNNDSFDKIPNAPKGLFRLGQAFILFMSLAVALLGGCIPAGTGEEPAISPVVSTDVIPTVPMESPPIEAIATPVPATPTALPRIETPTTEAGSTWTIPAPTLEPAIDTLKQLENEQLITFHPDGVYRIHLDTEQMELFIPNKESWQLFSARISADGHQVVYWFVEENLFQVWVTNTIDGESRQLLNITNDEFTQVDGIWHGQGSFFELAIRGEDENGVPWVEQWYLFDLLLGEIVGFANQRPGAKICHTLAVSPKSNEVALWCSFDSQFKAQSQYFVIEANGESWQALQAPEAVVGETTGSSLVLIWSPDGRYALLPESRNATIIQVLEGQAYKLFEQDDGFIGTYLSHFSPDNRVLSYDYDICENGDQCAKIMDLESRTVVWESTGLFSSPAYVYGWAPDGEFFIVDTFEGLFILRQKDFSIVKSLSNEVVTTIYTVWLDN